MKKLWIVLAALLFGVAGVQAVKAQTAPQGTVQDAPEEHKRIMTLDGLQEFAAIEAAGKIELAVTIDPEQVPSMSIEYNGNDQNKVKWWDDGGLFKIRFSSGSKDRPIVVKLTCKRLENLSLAAGASMTTSTPWVEKMVTIDLSTNAKLTATIEAVDIQLTAQTSAVAVISGIGTYASFEARTRGVVDAHGFEARSTTIRASGYAEGRVYGTERLVVDASDGASVFRRGSPDILRLHSSRGATINSIGE